MKKIEATARAMFGGDDALFDEVSAAQLRILGEQSAIRLIKRLRERGYDIMPLEPTLDMVKAAEKEFEKYGEGGGLGYLYPVSIFKAMIQAQEDEGGL